MVYDWLLKFLGQNSDLPLWVQTLACRLFQPRDVWRSKWSCRRPGRFFWTLVQQKIKDLVLIEARECRLPVHEKENPVDFKPGRLQRKGRYQFSFNRPFYLFSDCHLRRLVVPGALGSFQNQFPSSSTSSTTCSSSTLSRSRAIGWGPITKLSFQLFQLCHCLRNFFFGSLEFRNRWRREKNTYSTPPWTIWASWPDLLVLSPLDLEQEQLPGQMQLKVSVPPCSLRAFCPPLSSVQSFPAQPSELSTWRSRHQAAKI